VSPTIHSDSERDWPLWWFAALETAVERGDLQAAARAQRELKRLGVAVKYDGLLPLRHGDKGVAHAG
jgi:hypothetical protein